MSGFSVFFVYIEMKKETLTIDLVYDIICPWCYVGHQRLLNAIQKTNTTVEINLMPFQLKPSIPEEGISIEDYWKEKGIVEVNSAYEKVVEAAESESIVINPSVFSRIPNTLKIHQVVLLAQEKGVGLVVLHAIQTAYFSKGADLTQLTTLVKITKKFLAAKEVENAWNDASKLKDTVLSKEQKIKDLHIASVPSYIVDNKHRISGAVSNFTLVDMLLQLAPKESTQNFCTIEGGSC